jgi:hypothetical protein
MMKKERIPMQNKLYEAKDLKNEKDLGERLDHLYDGTS